MPDDLVDFLPISGNSTRGPRESSSIIAIEKGHRCWLNSLYSSADVSLFAFRPEFPSVVGLAPIGGTRLDSMELGLECSTRLDESGDIELNVVKMNVDVGYKLLYLVVAFDIGEKRDDGSTALG